MRAKAMAWLIRTLSGTTFCTSTITLTMRGMLVRPALHRSQSVEAGTGACETQVGVPDCWGHASVRPDASAASGIYHSCRHEPRSIAGWWCPDRARDRVSARPVGRGAGRHADRRLVATCDHGPGASPASGNALG